MPRTNLLRVFIALILIQCAFVFGEDAGADPGSKLVAALGPLLDVMTGKTERYTIHVDFNVGSKSGTAELQRIAARDYWLRVKAGKDIDGALSVTPTETRIDIGPKNVAFVGTGEPGEEPVQPAAILAQASMLSNGVQMGLAALKQGDREALSGALSLFAHIEVGETPNGAPSFKVITDKKGGGIQFSASKDKDHEDTWLGEFRYPGGTKDAPVENVITLSISPKAERFAVVQGRTEIAVPRAELERSIERGALRALDIQNDDMHSRVPNDFVVNIPGARLEVSHGQRVCYLTGTPAEMGHEHGKLLSKEIRKVADSTLYVVGMYYSIGKGQWFLSEIRDAWKRLEPNIDKQYPRRTRRNGRRRGY